MWRQGTPSSGDASPPKYRTFALVSLRTTTKPRNANGFALQLLPAGVGPFAQSGTSPYLMIGCRALSASVSRLDR